MVFNISGFFIITAYFVDDFTMLTISNSELNCLKPLFLIVWFK